MSTTTVFKRILLKLSGEALAATQGFGVDPLRIHEIAAELADVHSLAVQIAIVVGGGNFFRGVAEQARNMDRVSADRENPSHPYRGKTYTFDQMTELRKEDNLGPQITPEAQEQRGQE